MLTFGGVASAGIFDEGAKTVLDLAALSSGIDKCMVTQVLDDVVACGMQGDGTVAKFEQAYRDIASRVGVSLADGSDPEKAFSATHSGRVLGISYDLRRWVWWLAEDKLIPLLHMFKRVKESEEVPNGFMESLCGKINHYSFLVPGGQWQRGFLLPMQDSRFPTMFMWLVSDLARLQAQWWLVNLRAASIASSITDLRLMETMSAKIIYTDASGGASGKKKNGIGCYYPPKNWFYMPWPQGVRNNTPTSLGVRFASKLSALEGFAALTGLVTMPEEARNSEVKIYCDNAGFVFAFEAKYSRCPYTYTLGKAIYDVGEGLACRVTLVKTPRCEYCSALHTAH